MLPDHELHVGIQRERRSLIDDHQLAKHMIAQDVARGQRHLAGGFAEGDDVNAGVGHVEAAYLRLDHRVKIECVRPGVTDGERVVQELARHAGPISVEHLSDLCES